MSNKLPPKIVLIEENDKLRNSIANNIERYWFNVTRIADPSMVVNGLALHKPHIVIIGSSIKKFVDPLKLALDIRSNKEFSKVPFIFILEEDEDQNLYKKHFEEELVDVIYKPFNHSELMLSIKTILRNSNPVLQDRIIQYKELVMDLGSFQVQRGDKKIRLGPTEFKILHLLTQAPRTIFSREKIVHYIWGSNNDIDLRTVDVHINRLRTALKLSKNEPPLINTVRSAGYCLNLPNAS